MQGFAALMIASKTFAHMADRQPRPPKQGFEYVDASRFDAICSHLQLF
jgi:hypothetical protein